METVESQTSSESILQLSLDDFSGPLDLLLELARKGETDLTKVSMSKLADQYLSYLASYKKYHKHITADYLLMACALVLMKSKLLLPATDEDEDEDDLLSDPLFLALRLEHLNQIQMNLKALLSGQRIGETQFLRGQVDTSAKAKIPFLPTTEITVKLVDLYRSYGKLVASKERPSLQISKLNSYTVEEAYKHIRLTLGSSTDWHLLLSLLPHDTNKDILYIKSVVSAMFSASLELIRTGEIELSQTTPYSSLDVKLRTLTNNKSERIKSDLEDITI